MFNLYMKEGSHKKARQSFLIVASWFLIVIAVILFLIAYLRNWSMIFVWEAVILIVIGVILRIVRDIKAKFK